MSVISNMYSVKEVASKLNISNGGVYRLITNGDLESHRFGTTIRISDKQLDDFLELTAFRHEASKKFSRPLKHL